MVKHSKKCSVSKETKKEEALSLWKKYYNIILKNKTIIIEVMGVISFFFGIFGVYTYFESSNQISSLEYQLNESSSKISSLEYQLNETHKELIIAKNEINNVSLTNKNEILLAIYEVKSFGLDNQSRENFFQRKFNFSYEQAQEILKYLSKTDDYDLAFSSLIRNDFPASLVHFDMALIKDPTNNELKIGKSATLIGLNKTNDGRKILFEIEPISQDKKIINKLIGDSYYVEGNYSKSVDYYLLFLGYYFTEQDKKNIEGLRVFSKTCEIKASGQFDSPWISITNQNDGWKICEVRLKDFGIFIGTRYRLD